jgi:hypothetical protein
MSEDVDLDILTPPLGFALLELTRDRRKMASNKLCDGGIFFVAEAYSIPADLSMVRRRCGRLAALFRFSSAQRLPHFWSVHEI